MWYFLLLALLVRAEILDERELDSVEMIDLSERMEMLAGTPHSWEADRFPDAEDIEMLRSGWSYIRTLARKGAFERKHHKEEYIAVERLADRYIDILTELRDSKRGYVYSWAKRVSLARVRAGLGDEAFAKGELP